MKANFKTDVQLEDFTATQLWSNLSEVKIEHTTFDYEDDRLSCEGVVMVEHDFRDDQGDGYTTPKTVTNMCTSYDFDNVTFYLGENVYDGEVPKEYIESLILAIESKMGW